MGESVGQATYVDLNSKVAKNISNFLFINRFNGNVHYTLIYLFVCLFNGDVHYKLIYLIVCLVNGGVNYTLIYSFVCLFV